MIKMSISMLVSLLLGGVSFAKEHNVEVLAVIKTYEKALNENNVKVIMDSYGSTPTFMPQHAPAQIGRVAVEKAYENVFKAIDLDIVFDVHEIEVHGDTAWARTSSAGKTKILANGAEINEGNNEMFIFKKELGKWKIHQYLFSTNIARQ